MSYRYRDANLCIITSYIFNVYICIYMTKININYRKLIPFFKNIVLLDIYKCK